MKTTRKRMVMLLALVLILAMSVPAFAAGTDNGSITIDNAVPGQTYSIYQIFDLESYDEYGCNRRHEPQHQ